MELLWQQLIAQSFAEVVAVLCSLLYVHFAARQQLLCWPFALASTALYTWIFWETSLFFQSVLNAWYLLMAVYGWLTWRKMDQTEPNQIQRWGLTRNIEVMLGLFWVSVLLFQIVQFLSSEAILFLDVAIAVYSAFVTYMLTQKILENWLYWFFINSFTAWLCFQQELFLTTLLFLIYVVFSVKGYLHWRLEDRAVN
ncbi:nicotinamide riboside transporter PnuC [Planctobacterium marinum]|uniref:nicotinamide riboside transporter PnuC n=1 Tax=Planctobacterium marinum TaxID=1631968 RepID=UPI001E5AB42E|nr:nicotinamide riboside transporter PnuC [Planctobacterium marinum]MCC2604774.1 nicotinamide riboside transporter PnuC [Planctobacterium marinum]